MGIGTHAIGGAIDETGANARSGEDDRVDTSPVFSSGRFAGETFFQGDAGSAAEFSHADDEGGFQETALLQVFEQGGEAEVEAGHEVVFHGGEDVVVSVPAVEIGGGGVEILSAGVVVEEDGDPGDVGFDETAGEEAGLPCPVAAIAFADGVAFQGQVEGFAATRGVEHAVGLAVKRVEVSEFRLLIEFGAESVDAAQERLAGGDAEGGELFLSGESFEARGFALDIAE